MLATVHKLCHVPQASQITTCEKILTEIFLGVFQKEVRSWSHSFLIINLKTLAKKHFVARPENVSRRKKKLQWQLQNFLR